MGKFQDLANKVSGSSGSADYGVSAEISLKIDGRDFEPEQVSITDVMTETQITNEAGICEVRMQAIMPSDMAELPFPESDISKIKVGHSLEVLISNSSGKKFSTAGTIFTGFVESLEVNLEERVFTCVIHGMDAKMWMMANKFTGERGNNKSYKDIINTVLTNYSKQAKIDKIKLSSSAKLKNRCYQVGESDYEFLCKLAEMTGSLFFIDNEGKVKFCSPESLVSKSDKIAYTDGNVCKISLKASVWGTVSSVKVVASDSSDPNKTIEATSKSAKSIGSGKNSSNMVSQNYSSVNSGVRCITVYDDSIKSKEEAQALADAIYTQREENLVELELYLNGNPKLEVGRGLSLDGFGETFDGKYLVAGVKHVCGVYSDDGKYHTILKLRSNRSNL